MTYCLEKNPVSILWMWLFCVMSNDSSCITSYMLILRMHTHKETLCLIFFLFSLARPILVVCVFRDLTLQNPFITSMLLSPFMSQTVYNLLLGYMREWDITFLSKTFWAKLRHVYYVTVCHWEVLNEKCLRTERKEQDWLHFKIPRCCLCICMHMHELPFINEVLCYKDHLQCTKKRMYLS